MSTRRGAAGTATTTLRGQVTAGQGTDGQARDRDFQLASFAVERRLLTSAEVNLCLLELSEREERGEPIDLMGLLHERSLLTAYQIEALGLEFARAKPSHDGAGDVLLGRQILEKRLADVETVRRCLEKQAELTTTGEAPRLGELLVKEGVLAPNQVDALLGESRRQLLSCATCGQQYNVRGYDRTKTYRCKHCRGFLAEAADTGATGTYRPSESGPQPAMEEGLLASSDGLLSFDDASSSGDFAAIDSVGGVVIGQDFAGYRVVDRIAEGTMGYVFKVRKDGSFFALKVLKEPEDERGDARVARFIMEAHACQKIDHPYVVRVHDFGEEEGHHWLVMDYIEGQSLKDLIEKSRLRLDEGVSAVVRLAQGLQAAHDAGVVHRDLKPANILIRPTGEPVITDFGLARDLIDNPRITRAGFAVGTPNYMSPEQVRGERDNIGPASDVYALGVILYQIVTGELPFGANTTPELFVRINEGKPVAPRAKNPAVTRKLDRIILRAMHRSPAKRFQTALELSEALIGCLPDGKIRLPGHRERKREEKRYQRFIELLEEGRDLLEQGCTVEARETLRRAVFELEDPREMLQVMMGYLDSENAEYRLTAVKILLYLEEIGGWRPLIEIMRRAGRHPVETDLLGLGDDQVLRFLHQVTRSRSEALARKASLMRREIYLDREQFLAIWALPERSAEQQRGTLLFFADSLSSRGKDPARELTEILKELEPSRTEQISVVLGRQSDQFFAEARRNLATDRPARAARYLELTLLFAPANLLALLTRAELREQSGARSDALQDFRAALQLAPDNQSLQAHLRRLEHELAGDSTVITQALQHRDGNDSDLSDDGDQP